MKINAPQRLLGAVAGVDEAGRGPLAGPVTAASIVLPADYKNPKVVDSKKISPKVRERLFGELIQVACAWAVVSVGPRRIEEQNIREATRLAMRLAARKLSAKLRAAGSEDTVHFLVDGNTPMGDVGSFSEETIIGGDASVPVIAAASILAKVSRDRLMQRLEQRYPGYGFSKHKGYPTKFHCEQIRVLGPCRVHRRTFAGVREYVK